MLRAFVMLRGKDYVPIRKVLDNSICNRRSKITNETGVVVEYYVETFGWADFVICLWSPNIEMVHAAVEIIRSQTGADTTTLVGMIPGGGVALSEKIASAEEEFSCDNMQSGKIDKLFDQYIAVQKKRLSEIEDTHAKEPEAKEKQSKSE